MEQEPDMHKDRHELFACISETGDLCSWRGDGAFLTPVLDLSLKPNTPKLNSEGQYNLLTVNIRHLSVYQ